MAVASIMAVKAACGFTSGFSNGFSDDSTNHFRTDFKQKSL